MWLVGLRTCALRFFFALTLLIVLPSHRCDAQSGNLMLITQDMGANSANGLDNIIDIYAVSPFGPLPGSASLLNTVTVSETYVSPGGFPLPNNEVTVPVISNLPDFLYARIHSPSGAVTGMASTGTYGGAPLSISSDTSCPPLGGLGLGHYYTPASVYALALVDPLSGFVNTNALPTNSALPLLHLPLQSSLDCASSTPTLYRAVERGSFLPTLPTYSIERYTYDPLANAFSSSTFLPPSPTTIAAVQVVVGGWIAVISQSNGAMISIYDPASANPTVAIFTQPLPPGAMAIPGLAVFDAAASVLYAAVWVMPTGGGAPHPDIYYFDFNAYYGALIGLQGLVPRASASSVATLILQ